MTIPIIDDKKVREVLSVSDCVPVMANAIVAMHHRKMLAPQRSTTALFNRDQHLMVMPGAAANLGVFGVKTLSLYPENPAHGRPAIQGFIMLFDLASGAPIGLVDAASITAIRTAAASAVATKALAREDASTLALIGVGPQAETHLQAMLAVRPVTRVRVIARTTAKAQAFVQRVKSTLSSEIEFCVGSDIAAAVKDTDIICTLTSSRQPVLKGEWLQEGVHINMVGAHTPDTREVDTSVILRSRLFVEQKSTALHEAGDILIPLKSGDISEQSILGELAQVMEGEIDGRLTRHDITAYKSLGNASQDLAAAYEALMRAAPS